MIPLKEAMRIAETGEAFKVGFYTADYKRKTGGEYIEHERAFLKSIDGVKVKGDGVKTSHEVKGDGIAKTLDTKKPNHFLNDTRLLSIPGQAKPKKFHPRLMIMFNDMEVMY